MSQPAQRADELDQAGTTRNQPSRRVGLEGVLTLAFIGPSLVYVAAFLILPTLMLLAEAFTGKHGMTLQYVAALGKGTTLVTFENSIILSALAALVGLIAGGLTAYFVMRPGMPAGLRSVTTTFGAVAANFAGVPLAFAFIATLGSLGIITVWLKSIGINLYGIGFNLYSLYGLVIVYAYFQIPLMVIVITPAIEALRREWREAAENLGASAWDYWRHVGFPILLPSLLSAYILLFGNAFSAYATPYALTSGIIALVPIEISNVLSGNVMVSPQTGAALALGMIVVMVVIMGIYLVISRRVGRWVKR